jgi:hypothetical protein
MECQEQLEQCNKSIDLLKQEKAMLQQENMDLLITQVASPQNDLEP